MNYKNLMTYVLSSGIMLIIANAIGTAIPFLMIPAVFVAGTIAGTMMEREPIWNKVATPNPHKPKGSGD